MQRRAVLLLGLFLCALSAPGLAPVQATENWRANEIDPATWVDGPVYEGKPTDVPQPGNPVVKMVITYQPTLGAAEVTGEIQIELFQAWVPITAGNFVGLAEQGFWNGIFFHRIIDDFVIQSGDPDCTTVGIYPVTQPNCGSGGSGENIPLEIEDNMSHVDGCIGMARSVDPDSASSQFYICDGPQYGLDPENRNDEGYASFGVVRDGMSHVRAIAAVPTTNNMVGGIRMGAGPDRPAEEVHVDRIEMLGVVAQPADAGGVEDGGILETLSGAVGFIGTAFLWLWSLLLLAVAPLVLYAEKRGDGLPPQLSKWLVDKTTATEEILDAII